MRNILHVEADIKGQRRVPAYTVTQNDSVSIVVTVLDGGSPVNLDEVSTITLACTRRDGIVVVKDGAQSGPNEITFDLGTTEIELTGKVDAVIQLYSEDGRVSTIKFAFTVTKDPTGEGYVPSEDERTLIEVVLGDGPLVLQRAETAATSAEDASAYIDGKKPLIERFTGEQTNLQTQLDEVARGATNVETSQARVDEKGVGHTTLKARLDAEHSEVTRKLADKVERSALEVEKQRINNLISLPEGSTTNDARLEDIKVGVDGKVYNSPGEAVRKISTDLNHNTLDLVNDFSNGNFKTNSGWYGTTATITTSGNVLKLTPTGIYARLLSYPENHLTPNDIYYMSIDFKPIKETQVVNFPNFSPILDFSSNVVIGEFTTLSGISKATDSVFRFNMYPPQSATQFSDFEMYVKNAIAINLTKTFGKGNEPTKEIMDKLVKESPTIWWGERSSYTQKQLLDLTNFKIESNNQKIGRSRLKVMSYNAGTWYDGVTRVPDDEIEEVTYYTRRLFGEFDCDFILGQEFAKYFDVSNTILAIPHVLDFKYDFNTEGSYTHHSDMLRHPVISKTPLNLTSRHNFKVGNSNRHYIKTYSYVNGINVCFINTLLDKDDSLRNSQMLELITAMDKDEYVILGGDFNIKTNDEYDLFSNAGYALVNGGVFGWYHTLPSNPNALRPIDNIIVSPNIRIENVYTDTKREVDHRAIIAELSM